MEQSASFGYWLRRRRKAMDLTQAGLAERAGYAETTIRKIEADARRPSREMAERLADLLELSGEERGAFLKTARAELGADRLATPPPPPIALPSGATAEQAALAAEPSYARMPRPTTPLVGRERELASLRTLLADPESRLVTISGPGGVGKTRLAIEALGDTQHHFADGICFVALDAVSSAELLLPTIADALGFSLYAGSETQQAGNRRAQEQLLRFLRNRELLLVLDSLEQLVGDAPLLAEIVRQAPGVKLLVTSRERLNLRDEWVIELRGLPTPQNDSRSAIEHSAAAVLFLQHARRARGGFTPTDDELACISRICRLLEGLPLGIELAAAWARVISCAEIAAEIERSLDFLAATARDVPARHGSLRAVFDHSWSLLPETEQRALRQLSVFHGGFSRAAAEAILADESGVMYHSQFTILNALTSLVDKSLLRQTSGGIHGQARYDMHGLLRQYAAAKLQANAAECSAAQERHTAFYARWLAELETPLKSARQKATVAEIVSDIENLRAAWKRAVAQRNIAALGGAAGTLSWFYELRGLLEEGQEAFETAAAALAGASDSSEIAVFAQLELHHAWFRLRRFPPEAAELLAHHSVELLREHGTAAELATALLYSGLIDAVCGKHEQAQRLLDESEHVAAGSRDRWMAAFRLGEQGRVAQMRGAYAEALQLCQASLREWRAVGDPRGQNTTLGLLSKIALKLNEPAEAERLLRESLAISSINGDRWGIASALYQLGLIAQLQGEHDEAGYLLRESSALFEEIGDQCSLASIAA